MLLSGSGAEGLISNLMSELPTNLVSYSRPVRCIHWSYSESEENAVMVECEDGEKINADHVIVTVSLGGLLGYFDLCGLKALSARTF